MLLKFKLYIMQIIKNQLISLDIPVYYIKNQRIIRWFHKEYKFHYYQILNQPRPVYAGFNRLKAACIS